MYDGAKVGADANGTKLGADCDAARRTASAGEREPGLDVGRQIAHLKSLGVKFVGCTEEEACAYLTKKCSYFKLSAYMRLFSKRVGGPRDGQFISLDFAQLRALASLDQTLRCTLRPMTLDIEHFQKVRLLRAISEREGEVGREGACACERGPKGEGGAENSGALKSVCEADREDGCAIVADYMASLTPENKAYRERELRSSAYGPYGGAALAACEGSLPVWAFLELASFGTLVDFTRFCGKRWGDKKLTASHYDLKKVKSIRNACSHSSCIIPAFADAPRPYSSLSRDIIDAVIKTGITKTTRRKWLRNVAFQELSTTLVCYAAGVPEGKSKERAREGLATLFTEVERASDLLPREGPDAGVMSALGLIRGLTDSLGLLN